MTLEETLVFVDGAYLSKISKYFGRGKYLRVNLINFAKYLAQKQQLLCKHIYFYTAPPFQSQTATAEEVKRRANEPHTAIDLINN